ncbi:MAG: HEPN domain-containing protein [Fimbriimonadaceae bacterium]|nr:HEPN domain-containing protein [Fimbriimonadaceae bacterium]
MPGEPEKWLTKARQDERAAEILHGAGGARSLVAYHLQQAAEKRMKAEMAAMGLRPRKTHDLEEIAVALERPVTDEVMEALRSLSTLAWMTRYPDWDEPTEAEPAQFIAEHRRVVDWLGARD